MTSYTPRPWNDDDRDIHDYISYYSEDYEEYIPIYKIMKEYLDEEKERIYNIDSSIDYVNAFENMWQDLWENSSICSSNYSYTYNGDCYSDYSNEHDYELETLSSPVLSDTENDENIVDEVKVNENVDETISVTSKFYYI
jgi:hypothetical protein